MLIARSLFGLLGVQLWLIIASLFFYAWWNPSYLWVLIASALVNWLISKSFDKTKHKKTMLTIGIILNLAFLAYFKYANFFIDSINSILETSFVLEKIILPLAISFFTFQQIAYLVDVYKDPKFKKDFISYILFVVFFPQLLAGPIVHYGNIRPQIREKNFGQLDSTNLTRGLSILSIGLFKKVFLADNLAKLVDPVYTSTNLNEPLSFIASWIAVLAFSFQIYFDFSGYTDMAIGSAEMIGVKLPENFLSPYQATNIQDFWRKWHITLSNFLKDYLYIPLGGNQNGKFNTIKNLMITMLLGGLWHGAAWGFVLWGGIHGLCLISYNLWQKFSRQVSLAPFISTIITFSTVTLLWIFFRADTLSSGIAVFKSLVSPISGEAPDGWTYFLLLFSSVIIWFLPSREAWINGKAKISWSPNFTWGLFCGLIALTALSQMSTEHEFIYFQF